MSTLVKDFVLPHIKHHFAATEPNKSFSFPDITTEVEDLATSEHGNFTSAIKLRYLYNGTPFGETTIDMDIPWSVDLNDVVKEIQQQAHTNLRFGYFRFLYQEISKDAFEVLVPIYKHSKIVSHEYAEILRGISLCTLIRKLKPAVLDEELFTMLKEMSGISYEDDECVVLNIFNRRIPDDLIFIKGEGSYKVTNANNNLYKRKRLADQLSN